MCFSNHSCIRTNATHCITHDLNHVRHTHRSSAEAKDQSFVLNSFPVSNVPIALNKLQLSSADLHLLNSRDLINSFTSMSFNSFVSNHIVSWMISAHCVASSCTFIWDIEFYPHFHSTILFDFFLSTQNLESCRENYHQKTKKYLMKNMHDFLREITQLAKNMITSFWTHMCDDRC